MREIPTPFASKIFKQLPKNNWMKSCHPFDTIGYSMLSRLKYAMQNFATNSN